MKTIRILAIVAACLWSTIVRAADFNVNTLSGLQGALAKAASNGQDDTITIAAGRYDLEKPLSYISKEQYSISIIGAGPGQTILDGGNKVQILLVDTTQTNSDNKTTIKIARLSFQNGCNRNGGGGGLELHASFADVSIESSEFINNIATSFPDDIVPTEVRVDGAGGAIFMVVGHRSPGGGNTFIGNCIFKSNKAYNGGAVYTQVEDAVATSTFVNNILDGNSASEDGGGFWIDGAMSIMLDK